MSLLARANEVPEAVVPMKSFEDSGGLSTKQVFGREMSLMVATRGPGYHSRPHVHECEQLNYVASGEIWIFVEETATRLGPGDFFRVPRMKVHWAWNRGEKPCEIFEAHAPGLDLLPRSETVDLLESGEDDGFTRVPNIWASDEYVESAEEGLNGA